MESSERQTYVGEYVLGGTRYIVERGAKKFEITISLNSARNKELVDLLVFMADEVAENLASTLRRILRPTRRVEVYVEVAVDRDRIDYIRAKASCSGGSNTVTLMYVADRRSHPFYELWVPVSMESSDEIMLARIAEHLHIMTSWIHDIPLVGKPTPCGIRYIGYPGDLDWVSEIEYEAPSPLVPPSLQNAGSTGLLASAVRRLARVMEPGFEAVVKALTHRTFTEALALALAAGMLREAKYEGLAEAIVDALLIKTRHEGRKRLLLAVYRAGSVAAKRLALAGRLGLGERHEILLDGKPFEDLVGDRYVYSIVELPLRSTVAPIYVARQVFLVPAK